MDVVEVCSPPVSCYHHLCAQAAPILLPLNGHLLWPCCLWALREAFQMPACISLQPWQAALFYAALLSYNWYSIKYDHFKCNLSFSVFIHFHPSSKNTSFTPQSSIVPACSPSPLPVSDPGCHDRSDWKHCFDTFQEINKSIFKEILFSIYP